MGMIQDAHRDLIKEVGLCFVATATSDGVPNVSPKGSIMVVDDDYLAFADIMSPHTRANLEQNKQIAVFVCKPEKFQGFQFKGTVELSKDGPVFDTLAESMKAKGVKQPIQNAVRIKVEEVRSLGE